MFPLQIGAPEAFEIVRQTLDRAGYRDQPLRDLLGIARLSDVLDGKGAVPRADTPCALGLLARLFLLGDYVPAEELDRGLADPAVAAMRTLGLVREEDGAPEGACFAPVMMAPVGDLYFVSDRVSRPDRKPFVAPGDMVFAAITPETGRFLRLLPPTPCGRLLDLGAGTGVGALIAAASGTAREAVAADITARATHFAEFNRRLNAITNVAAVEGDLYAPVGGAVFDRIIAHPPYVPALKTEWVFRDAGETGEAITRGVIAGLPTHLAAGGRLYCLTTGLDLKARKLEERVRDWLGGGAAFDIALIEFDRFTLKNVAADLVLRGQRRAEEGRSLLTGFENFGAEAFIHGLIVIERHHREKPCITVRKTAGPRTGSAEIEWLLDWSAASVEQAFTACLLAARLRATESFELRIVQRFEEGALAVSGMNLQTDYPFEAETGVQPWVVQFLAGCGRPRSGQELYDDCRGRGLIRGEVSATDFAGLLRLLVDQGFLEMEGFSLPAAEE